MDDVVGNARMLWLFNKEWLQNVTCFFLVCIRLVGGIRGRQQGERMKDGGFMVVWIVRLELVHCLFISESASAVIKLVVVLVKRRESGDVVPLSLRLGAGCIRLFRCRPTRFEVRRPGRGPDLMVVRHGDSPVRHATGRVLLCYSGKGIVGLLVPKGMERCHCEVKLRLNSWVTRNSKSDPAKFCWVASGMVMLGNCWCDECDAHADKQHHGHEGESVHGELLTLQQALGIKTFDCRDE